VKVSKSIVGLGGRDERAAHTIHFFAASLIFSTLFSDKPLIFSSVLVKLPCTDWISSAFIILTRRSGGARSYRDSVKAIELQLLDVRLPNTWRAISFHGP